jgi:methyl-accepting chemotaxis protein
LIDDSVEKVDAGGKLVNAAGQTMDDIVTSVKHVADIMNAISMASQEQSQGIGQANQAIALMDSVTQQNAALVEQAAAAAESLQEQAARLDQMVSVFKLGNEYQVAAPAIAAHPAPLKTPATVKRAVLATRQPPAPKALAGSKESNDDSWEEF